MVFAGNGGGLGAQVSLFNSDRDNIADFDLCIAIEEDTVLNIGRVGHRAGNVTQAGVCVIFVSFVVILYSHILSCMSVF